ncbi:MAG TPA: hypothetical protein DCE65_06730 [Clostridiales bacterium]|nr:hypothetical protein [Clostridiales bacterium]
MISFFSGSCPKEFDEATILAVPVLICVIGVAFGGIFLGKYFLRVARKTGIFKKTENSREASEFSRAQFGAGMFIMMYYSVTFLLVTITVFCRCGLLG